MKRTLLGFLIVLLTTFMSVTTFTACGDDGQLFEGSEEPEWEGDVDEKIEVPADGNVDLVLEWTWDCLN
jgi:hypothetical protein